MNRSSSSPSRSVFHPDETFDALEAARLLEQREFEEEKKWIQLMKQQRERVRPRVDLALSRAARGTRAHDQRLTRSFDSLAWD
jgi:hypothetical protein